MPEQFAFQQGFRQSTAIHRHKLPVGPRPFVMNGGGHQFLAGSAFSLDQHGNRGVRQFPDQVEHLLHLLVSSHNAGEMLDFTNPPGQFPLTGYIMERNQNPRRPVLGIRHGLDGHLDRPFIPGLGGNDKFLVNRIEIHRGRTFAEHALTTAKPTRKNIMTIVIQHLFASITGNRLGCGIEIEYPALKIMRHDPVRNVLENQGFIMLRKCQRVQIAILDHSIQQPGEHITYRTKPGRLIAPLGFIGWIRYMPGQPDGVPGQERNLFLRLTA